MTSRRAAMVINRRMFGRLGLGAGLALRGVPATASTLPAGFLGINTLWIPGDEAILLDRFRRARALGLSEVRIDWEWRLAEPVQGSYDWRATDRLMRAANQSGVTILPIVHYAPPWALPAIPKPSDVSELAPTDASFDAFGRFLAACVKRYGPGGDAPMPFTPIVAWQVWNEPNNKDFWGPAPEPARFAKLMRSVSGALAPYRNRIKIVHAGLSKADVVFLWQLWDADPNYGDTFDIMAVHPYIYDWWSGVRRPDDIDGDKGPDAVLGFIGDKYKPNYLPKVFNLQLFMTLRGVKDRPIWITEMGFFVSPVHLGVTDEQQAKLMADTLSYIQTRLTDKPFGEGKHALAADVQRVYWFALDDYTMPDGMGNFGLYRVDGTQRPSAQVMRKLLS